MDEIVFSSLIAFNRMLTSHCDNLATHHYRVAYHPCFNTQFRHTTIFLRGCHIFQWKAKAIELPFCTKEIGKKKTRKLFWQGLGWQEKGIHAKVVRHSTTTKSRSGSCAWQFCGGNFVALFVTTDHMDQKAICIVSYPVYYHHSYPAARIWSQ